MSGSGEKKMVLSVSVQCIKKGVFFFFFSGKRGEAVLSRF